MGLFLFAGQILTWLPPLLYTALNESGVDPQFSICSLGVWFFLGMFALWAVGDYRTAVVAAGRGNVLEASNDHPIDERDDCKDEEKQNGSPLPETVVGKEQDPPMIDKELKVDTEDSSIVVPQE